MIARTVLLCLCLCAAVNSARGQVASICRPNERLLFCGGCQKTCDNPAPDCKGTCRTGCYCPPNQVRDNEGKCIFLHQCPSVAHYKLETTEPRPAENCPKNEEYRFCEPCNKTCDNPNPICPSQCARGCFCTGQLVRDRDGRCVPVDKCHKKNGERNEEEKREIEKVSYASGINDISYQDDRPVIINNIGPFYDEVETTKKPAEFSTNNYGILKPEYLSSKCPENEEFRLCEPCIKTCQNPNPICPAQCSRGCFCKGDLLRDTNGQCVTKKKCATIQTTQKNTTYDPPYMPYPIPINCGSNMVYKQCETCEKTCSNPTPVCVKQCLRGCFCKSGFYKSPSGQCVQLEHCPRGLYP